MAVGGSGCGGRGDGRRAYQLIFSAGGVACPRPIGRSQSPALCAPLRVAPGEVWGETAAD